MELDRVEDLLARYFEAETTIAEEKKLKEYFARPDVAAHLEQYRPMFGYLNSAKSERFTGKVPLKKSTGVSLKRLYPWLSVAAVMVLMVGTYFGKDYYDQQQLEKQKAEYAYQETRKALAMLAENFNRGTEKVAYLNEFVEAQEKIYNKN